MASVYTGAYVAFIGSSAFNSSQIDLLFTGKVPSTTSTSPMTWTRLLTSMDGTASITCAANSISIGTQETGPIKTVQTSADTFTFQVPVADISINTFRKYLQLNQAYSTSTGAGLPGSYNNSGVNFTAKALPILIYNKQYHPSSQALDTPVIGTGGDPQAWCFTAGSLANRNFTVSYNPAGQQIQDVTFGFYNTTGTTLESFGYWFGAMTLTS